MPPAKRTTAPQARHSKRLRTDLTKAGPSSVVENPPMPQQQTGQGGEMQGGQGVIQLDMRAHTSIISVAVTGRKGCNGCASSHRLQYDNANTNAVSRSRAGCTKRSPLIYNRYN